MDKMDKKNSGKTDNDQQNSRLLIVLAALSFIVPLLLIYSYNYSDKNIVLFGWELKKLSSDSEEFVPKKNNVEINIIKQNRKQEESTDIKKVKRDSLLKISKFPFGDPIIDTNEFERSYVDSSEQQRIMIMGDSECGGLYKQLNDYCFHNGHSLVATVVWNSATILNFAYSDTIPSIINKFQPTYIFIVVGLNELLSKSLGKRREAAELLASKLNGIRYSWIGPANYTSDFGINKVFLESAEHGAFFLSRDLNLPKGTDNRHPNATGYRIWMDSIAKWMKTTAKYPLIMNTPIVRNHPCRSKVIILNASKYRGY